MKESEEITRKMKVTVNYEGTFFPGVSEDIMNNTESSMTKGLQIGSCWRWPSQKDSYL